MGKRINNLLVMLVLVMVVIFFSTDLYARGINDQANFAFNKPAAGKYTQSLSNIGNWGFWINYEGQTGHDPFTGSSGGYYPRGTAAAIYMDGVIWGGWLNGGRDKNTDLRVGGIGYQIGTQPGWIEGGSPVDPDNERARLYRIRTDWETLSDAMVLNDAAEINNVGPGDVTPAMTQGVIAQYKQDWEEWPVDLGAPWVDVNGDGVYTAGTDEPGIANADQVIWTVVNDLNPAKVQAHSGVGPIGFELQITLWAYNQAGAGLGQIVFKKYRLINKSTDTIDSMFIAQYSDPDVGAYSDDVVGCDVEKSLHFVYNGSPEDGEYVPYGLKPPSAGYDFFQGPLIKTDNPADTAVWDLKYRMGYKNLPMTSFGYFAAGSAITDPPQGEIDFTWQWYNMLNGYTPTNELDVPTPYVRGSGPQAGEDAKFPLDGDPPSDPDGNESDIDGKGANLAPGDRRMFACSGPFTMAPGDTQEVVVALVGEIGADNISSVAAMKEIDVLAQKLFDDLFATVPKPPAAPKVNMTPVEETIVLNWGFDAAGVAATEAKNALTGYDFEGYNVWQLPSATSSLDDAYLIGTFDLVNGVTTVLGKRFIPEYGMTVEIPVQFGLDKGVQRHFTADRDYINQTPLLPGSDYYFAVTAYNYNPDPKLIEDKALESAAIVTQVRAQGTKPGQRFGTKSDQAIAVEKLAGSSDGSVEITVVDPSQTEGGDYKVGFYVDTDTNSATHGETLWKLMDGSGTTVYEGGVQLAPGAKGLDSPVINGVKVKVFGPPVGINPFRYGVAYGEGSATSLTYLGGWDFRGDRWISGTDWGAQALFNGMDNGYNFFGSTLTEGTDFFDITVYWAADDVFADSTAEGAAAASQAQYPDYWSKGATYWRSDGYAHRGTADIPFAAYDVESDPPRRLNITIVEDANAGSANNLWDMGWDGSEFPALGGREYIFFNSTDYDEGATYDGSNDGTVQDVLYAIWPASRSRRYLHALWELDVFASNVNTPSDEFGFTVDPNVNSSDLAKEDVGKVNVFPNPYYASNSQEPDRFNRFVTFNHLPQKADIRIFNLAGIQTRKLVKDDDTQFLRWDLQNEAQLPVASGMYIAYVDMPDLGVTKILKIMVIQSEQIIQYY